jgi:hypothetical protein
MSDLGVHDAAISAFTMAGMRTLPRRRESGVLTDPPLGVVVCALPKNTFDPSTNPRPRIVIVGAAVPTVPLGSDTG